MLKLSSSEEVDVLSIEAGDIEDSPLLFLAYEELVVVIARDVSEHRLAGRETGRSS